MKRAIIFLHGDKPKKALVKKNILPSDYIICADGGADYPIEFGFVPHVVIGDEDSITHSLKKKLKQHKVKWVKYPRVKDESDSELAILHAIEKGYKHILLFGVFGNRVDHFLANIFFLSELAKDIKWKIIQDDQEIYIVKDVLRLRGSKGDYLSLIPLKGDVLDITTKGLKFVLEKETLIYSKTRGVSNEFILNKAEVVIKKGQLLAVHTRRKFLQ